MCFTTCVLKFTKYCGPVFEFIVRLTLVLQFLFIFLLSELIIMSVSAITCSTIFRYSQAPVTFLQAIPFSAALLSFSPLTGVYTYFFFLPHLWFGSSFFSVIFNNIFNFISHWWILFHFTFWKTPTSLPYKLSMQAILRCIFSTNVKEFLINNNC